MLTTRLIQKCWQDASSHKEDDVDLKMMNGALSNEMKGLNRNSVMEALAHMKSITCNIKL